MKILVNEGTMYECKCAFCDTTIVLERTDLKDLSSFGDFDSMAWKCPVCCITNRTSRRELFHNKRTHYKLVDVSKEDKET